MSEQASDEAPLLDVRGLRKEYPITEGILRREAGRVKAVDGIDLQIGRGEALGLIGESGCGKSTAATSLLRVEEPTDGELRFDGEDLTAFSESELRAFRRRAAMVFQDPNETFDPRMLVGESVAEPLRIHGMRDRSDRLDIVTDLLDRVGLGETVWDRFPHELSGGQKQRAALARALVLDPDLLVLDEPTSALDVSVQAEILHLLDDLATEFDLSLLVITHDIGVARVICDRVAVMYLGGIVERGPAEQVFETPKHPYTEALVGSVPSRRADADDVELSGEVPDAADPPSSCRFHTRCPQVIPPEKYALPQAEFRRVMDLRDALDRSGFDRTALPKRGDLRRAVRDAYDLPASLGDADAEAVLSETIGLIIDGDADAAAALLEREFA
ncbi:MAG: oligopeptide/dipeptide ABC transporter ATP-binding protein, partial [Halolamina sp.]